MRHVSVVVSVMLLGGCAGSGFGTYVHDTTRLPWHNPNQPQGSAPNHEKVLAVKGALQPAPLVMAPAGAWPGPPKAIPSLQDLQRQQNDEMASGTYAPHAMSGDLPQLPGYAVTPPPEPLVAPKQSFPTGVVSGVEGKAVGSTGGAEVTRSVPGPDAHGNIVVPNGDGSSTVIGRDGSVTTQPAPK